VASRLVRGPEGRLEERYSEAREKALLWFGFLGGAAAWKLQLMVNYMLVPYACWHGLSITIHLASLATLLVAAGAGWVSYGRWRETGGDPFGSGDENVEVSSTVARSRFMTVSGLLMSGFFSLLIVGQWIPNLLLSPCFGID
jgi:hypothetical protein